MEIRHIGPPISEFAARIVGNDEYEQLVQAISQAGGDVKKLMDAAAKVFCKGTKHDANNLLDHAV